MRRNLKKSIVVLCVIQCLYFFVAANWGQANEASHDSPLTFEEQTWLNEHDGKIRLAPCPGWEPMEIYDKNGTYRGFVADYIHLIEKKLNFKFKLIYVDSWAKIEKMSRNRELDVISAATPTKERQDYMSWTKPYYKSPITIICRKDLQGNLNIKDLLDSGKKVGFCRDWAPYDYFKTKYGEKDLIQVETLLEGLKKVSFGEMDAIVAELPHTLYYIEKLKITNLRLGGMSDYHADLSIGSRNDWPILNSILAKGLAMVSEKERQEISKRWINLAPMKLYEFKSFWYIIVALLLITLVILFVNKSLKREVGRQTKDLKLNGTRLEALLDLHQIEKQPIQKIMSFACEKAVQLTGSQFGYLAFADKEDFFFSNNSFQKLRSQGGFLFHKSDHFPVETMGLWRDAVRKKKPVIADCYATTNPLKKGVPKQYKDIARYMNIPILNEGQVVAVAGVGNKETSYTETDIRQLSLLMEGLWRVIQRKDAERLIRNSEKQFRDLVENSLTGISIVQNGDVVYSNPEQNRQAGFLQLLEAGDFEHIHPDCRNKTMNFFKRVKKGVVGVPEVDFAFFANDIQDESDISWVNCRACEIEYQGEKGILLNTIDITRTKQMERLLISQEKMVSLGHIAAGIAHEIRNPLAGIGIHLRNLEKKYMGDNQFSEKIKKSFQLIHSDAARIESVVRRTLDFAKPATYSFEIIDINIPVQKAIQHAEITLQRQQVSIESDLEQGILLCRAEPQLIADVVYNLIINAADAMKEVEGERKILIHSWTEKNNVVIRVDDTGLGVSKALREKIFEPFFTTKHYNTGIGLGICARIITDHGGAIDVSSNQKGGARFIVKIPAS